MSGISSVSTAAAQYTSASMSTGPMRGSMDPSQMADRMEQGLDAALTEAGVSEETRTALEADIRAAMEEDMADGTPSDPEAMKETIDGIFAEYGLEAEDYMPQGPPPGGGPPPEGGMGGTESSSTTQSEALQSLIETLQSAAEEDGADLGSLLDQFSQDAMDIMLGIDTTV